jgi:hypothetical protein
MSEHRLILRDNFTGVSKRECERITGIVITDDMKYFKICLLLEKDITDKVHDVVLNAVKNNDTNILREYAEKMDINLNNRMKSKINTYRIMVEIVQHEIRMPMGYNRYEDVLEMFSAIFYHWYKFYIMKYYMT